MNFLDHSFTNNMKLLFNNYDEFPKKNSKKFVTILHTSISSMFNYVLW